MTSFPESSLISKNVIHLNLNIRQCSKQLNLWRLILKSEVLYVFADLPIITKMLPTALPKTFSKGHSFCKQCLHNLQFKKTRYSSPNLSKLARVDISCQFKKTRYLCRHCLQNKWTLVSIVFLFVNFVKITLIKITRKTQKFIHNSKISRAFLKGFKEVKTVFSIGKKTYH